MHPLAIVGAISYDPIVHVSIGPLRISPHGVGIAVGFLLGARLMLPESRRKGISDDHVYAILVRAAIGAMLGARIAYVLNHAGSYDDDPLAVLRVWEGGISLLGGIFGAILLALPLIRRLGVDLWRLLDSAAPGLALGIVIGRIGDLVVGDHLGKATEFALGYRCPPATVETASPCLAEVVHQTALYDFILTGILLAVLLALRARLRERPRFDGFLIMVFGAWYGVGRVVEDVFREDVRRGGLTGSQWTAVVTVAVCLVWLAAIRRPPRWGHWEPAAVAGDGTPDGSADGTDEASTDTAEPMPTIAAAPHPEAPDAAEER